MQSHSSRSSARSWDWHLSFKAGEYENRARLLATRTQAEHLGRIEQALRESEARLRLAQQAAHAGTTGQKVAAQALRDSEARYSMLAEALPAIIFTSSPTGETDYVNRQWQEYIPDSRSNKAPLVDLTRRYTLTTAQSSIADG